MTKDDYDKALDKLTELLKAKPLSARAIAKALRCCRPTAYARLAALRERGAAVYEMTARESVTGPDSTLYGVRA